MAGRWNTLVAKRLERGLSQDEMARRSSKLTQHSISLVENQHRMPSLGVVWEIAKVLGTTMDEIFPPEEVEAYMEKRRRK